MQTGYAGYIEQREQDTTPNLDLLKAAGKTYDSYRHDPDSIGFDNSYTGPSERDLMGGCKRCGGLDDCYCPSPCLLCKGTGEKDGTNCPECDGAGQRF